MQLNFLENNIPTSHTCHFVQGEETQIKDDNCLVTSCQDRHVNVTVLDKTQGKIDVFIYAVPITCHLTRYQVSLVVLDQEVPDTPSTCNTKDSDWAIHSRRDIFIDYCDSHDTDCRERSKPCQQAHEVTFRYVFTAWYQIKITPHVGSSTWQSQRSQPIYLVTDYKKKGIVDLNETVSSLQHREEKNESRVNFLFDPALDWESERSFHVSLKLLTKVNGTLGSSACYESGEEHSCCTFYGRGSNKTAVDCSVTRGQSTPQCRATRNAIECLFSNMTHGNVCAVLTFHDDRCEPGTIWTAPDNRPCQWQSYKEFPEDVKITSESSSTSNNILYAVIIITIAIILLVCSLFAFKRIRLKKRQRLAMERIAEEEEPVHQFNFDELASRHFSIIDQLTLTERPRPEVLLVYAHDTKPFMELVICLRKVLDKICKCRVYDYFDEEYFNMISIDPEGWVQSLIIQREAKVIVVTNNIGAKRHQALIDTQMDTITYKNPHSFDHLFTFAMKILRDMRNSESYKNHFVVTFDGYTDHNDMLEYFNPYTRFVLPKHLNKLFEHLHDSNKTVHFETNRKLEERFEVRQLRLQLERLINLKLLAKSDLTNQKIYDW